MWHVTQAKRKLRERLLVELPGRLAQADADAGDGIVTPVPYEIHTTDKADLGGLPSLQLIVTNSAPQVNSYARIYRHRVPIGVTVGGDVEETISIQLERYVWCVRQIIRDCAITPVEGTADADTGAEQYTPLTQRPATVEWPLVKSVYIEIFVTTIE